MVKNLEKPDPVSAKRPNLSLLHYSKCIFRNSMSHNLQRAEENGDNIKFYWINFIISLLFLWKQFYIVSFNNVSVVMNLKNSEIEIKLDNTFYDSEVTIDGYSIVRNDRNRKGGGVACYIRSNICYSRKTCLSDNLENIFIDLLFQKTKPISVGIFYKPPSQTRYLEQIITEFQSLELNNELYILGDLNINLLFKGNCILNKSHEIKNHFRDFSPKYNEFCSIYGFKQLINCPTRIACNTSTFIDHILTNSQDNISQSGVIDTAISDHNMRYCTTKILKTKYNKHKELTFYSLRNYSFNVYKQVLERASFPKYDNFHNPDIAYNDFINRLDCVVNAVAPFKTVRVKNNTSGWFDGEIADKTHTRDKLY